MQFEKRQHKKVDRRNYNSFVLGGDIGGTNTNLGVFGVKNNLPGLILSFHFKSNELKGLHDAVNETLAYIQEKRKIKITKACFAVAGVLSPNKDFAKVTNAKWDVSKNLLLKKTKLKDLILINDFEAVGYGINMLSKKDIAIIKKAKKNPKAPILVVGAGTGLGKTMLVYDEHY